MLCKTAANAGFDQSRGTLGVIKQNYVLALGVNSAGTLEGALAHWAHHANDQGRRR